jgi:hypothetical protein
MHYPRSRPWVLGTHAHARAAQARSSTALRQLAGAEKADDRFIEAARCPGMGAPGMGALDLIPGPPYCQSAIQRISDRAEQEQAP